MPDAQKLNDKEMPKKHHFSAGLIGEARTPARFERGFVRHLGTWSSATMDAPADSAGGTASASKAARPSKGKKAKPAQCSHLKSFLGHGGGNVFTPLARCCRAATFMGNAPRAKSDAIMAGGLTAVMPTAPLLISRQPSEFAGTPPLSAIFW